MAIRIKFPILVDLEALRLALRVAAEANTEVRVETFYRMTYADARGAALAPLCWPWPHGRAWVDTHRRDTRREGDTHVWHHPLASSN